MHEDDSKEFDSCRAGLIGARPEAYQENLEGMKKTQKYLWQIKHATYEDIKRNVLQSGLILGANILPNVFQRKNIQCCKLMGRILSYGSSPRHNN